jgi:hypothetical protein
MTRVDDAKDGADAVQRFRSEIDRTGRAPERIQARFDGEDGMARLCAVEAVLSALWPPSTAKELIWLTRSGLDDGARLHLRAFAADGELFCDATFRLDRRDA